MVNGPFGWLEASLLALNYCHLFPSQAVESIADEVYEAVGTGHQVELGQEGRPRIA